MLVLISSCTVQQELIVKSDFSGTASGMVELHPVFADYLSSFSEITGGDAEFSFDLKEIKEGLEKGSGTKVDSLDSPKPEELSFAITYTNLENLLSQEPGVSQSGLIRLSREGDIKKMSIYLDRENYPDLVKLIPALDNPLFSALGPLENKGISEEEYLEMMEYALGEEGPDLIKKSTVSMTVKVAGIVTDQRGGRKITGGVEYIIPLIRILLLDKPIDLYVEFK